MDNSFNDSFQDLWWPHGEHPGAVCPPQTVHPIVPCPLCTSTCPALFSQKSCSFGHESLESGQRKLKRCVVGRDYLVPLGCLLKRFPSCALCAYSWWVVCATQRDTACTHANMSWDAASLLWVRVDSSVLRWCFKSGHTSRNLMNWVLFEVIIIVRL